MATAVATPLSNEYTAEPAQPEERKKKHLPPKSYADAVEEEAPATNGANGNDSSNGTGSVEIAQDQEDAETPKPTQHAASVLRIVDTGAPEPAAEKKKKKKQVERPIVDRQESKREYSANGLDDTPKSPPRQKHRKTASRKENSASSDGPKEEKSVGPAKSELANEKPAKEVGKDEKSPSGESAKSEVAIEKPTKEVGKDEKIPEFEKVEVERNGSKLISIKSPVKDKKSVRIDQKEEPKAAKDDELVSGRKAGQRWEKSAIRFAPLNVPLQRRLQTLVVLFHTLCIALSVSVFFFLCAIPLFWPLLIPYMIYCMASKASTSGTLNHRSEFLRKLPVWSLFASYFPARLHRTQVLPPTRKYVFGYHPHGIISMGAFAAFGTEALGFSQLFPGIKNTLLTLDSNFRIPLYRDYALAMGLASVSKESCENLLTKGGPNKEGMGRGITIVVGGARESLDAEPYSLRLVLKRRKGFVKIAIRTGADLVPVLAFGENDLYDQFQVDSHPMIHKFQLLVKKVLGFTIPLFHARGVFNYDVGLMPYRRPINIVVGRPVRVTQSANPAQEEIDRLHEEYVKELERLWDTWRDEFAPKRKSELEIIE